MQVRLRDVRLSKPPVSESKTILISGLHFFSGEENFCLSGHVNKQNMRFWAQTRSHMITSIANLVCRKWLFGARWA